MRVYIKTLNGDEIPVEINPTDTITVIRHKVLQQGTDTNGHEIIFKGKSLRDYHTALHYGIQGESTLHIFNKSCGIHQEIKINQKWSEYVRMFQHLKWNNIPSSYTANQQFAELIDVIYEVTGNKPSRIRDRAKLIDILQTDPAGYYNYAVNKEFINNNLSTQVLVTQVTHPNKTCLIGIALIIISTILFSLNGVLIKYASNMGYPSMEIFLFRSAMQILITIIATLLYDKSSIVESCKGIGKPSIKWIWIILRGLMAAISGMCYFHAITIIPLGDAVTVFSIYPIITAFVGWLILQQRPSATHRIALGFALCVSIIGIYLIAKNAKDKTQLYYGYFLSVLGAFSGGFVFMFIRLATKRISPIVLLYSHGLFSLLLSFIIGFRFQGFNWYKDKSGYTIMVIIGFGLVCYFGAWTMNKSIQFIPTSLASLIRSSECMISYIWQSSIFLTIPTTDTVIGAICIVVGLILMSFGKCGDHDIHPEAIPLNDNNDLQSPQYGAVNTMPNVLSKDCSFASNLSLDPNDSYICLIAKQ